MKNLLTSIAIACGFIGFLFIGAVCMGVVWAIIDYFICSELLSLTIMAIIGLSLVIYDITND